MIKTFIYFEDVGTLSQLDEKVNAYLDNLKSKDLTYSIVITEGTNRTNFFHTVTVISE